MSRSLRSAADICSPSHQKRFTIPIQNVDDLILYDGFIVCAELITEHLDIVVFDRITSKKLSSCRIEHVADTVQLTRLHNWSVGFCSYTRDSYRGAIFDCYLHPFSIDKAGIVKKITPVLLLTTPHDPKDEDDRNDVMMIQYDLSTGSLLRTVLFPRIPNLCVLFRNQFVVFQAERLLSLRTIDITNGKQTNIGTFPHTSFTRHFFHDVSDDGFILLSVGNEPMHHHRCHLDESSIQLSTFRIDVPSLLDIANDCLYAAEEAMAIGIINGPEEENKEVTESENEKAAADSGDEQQEVAYEEEIGYIDDAEMPSILPYAPVPVQMNAISIDTEPSPPSSSSRPGRTVTGDNSSNKVEPLARREASNEVLMMMLKNWAANVIRLWVPVSLCIAVVVLSINTVKFNTENNDQKGTPFDSEDEDSVDEVLESFGFATALLLISTIGITVIFVLYKFRCNKVIDVGLLVGSCVLLTAMSALYITGVLKSLNMSASTSTIVFCLFNYVVVGMICIHWKGPLILQQAYQISMSALAVLTIIKYLPDGTLWAFLLLGSIWDLVNVLAPKAPLRMIVELAQERNESIIPSLAYSCEANDEQEVKGQAMGREHDQATGASSSMAPGAAESGSAGSRGGPAKRSIMPEAGAQPAKTLHEDTEENVVDKPGRIQLGLGDFFFYAALVGQASTSFDWNATVACYVGIIIGLFCTLLLMDVFRKPLPALPISIFTGIVFYFTTSFVVSPFLVFLNRHQALF